MTSREQDLECIANDSLRLSQIDQIMTPKSLSSNSFNEKIFDFENMNQIKVHEVSKSQFSSQNDSYGKPTQKATNYNFFILKNSFSWYGL